MGNKRTPKPENAEAVKQLAILVKKTNSEKPSAQETVALRRALQNYEVFWRRASDLTQIAHKQLLSKMPAVARESITLRLEALQRDLGYAEASAIERLLIEQIVTCWLHTNTIQIAYAGALADLVGNESTEHWERRLAAAQKRYLKAINMLAQIRRRRAGAVQVNIGAQQVNVVGKVTTGRGRVRE